MLKKTKTCKVCRASFSPFLSTAKVCSISCAQSLAVSIRGKAEKMAAVLAKRETKEKLKKLKSKAIWAGYTQKAFNAWICARDYGRPCISCGQPAKAGMQAGHFLSVGARPELRFNPENCHSQCVYCNMHKAGNVILYRISLVDHIGLAAVEALEGPHPLPHHTVDDLQAIRADYAARAKAIVEART